MITIVDYGMGNLRSVQKGFEKVGLPAEITREPRRILEADGVVLPGVGAFGRCMENLALYNLLEVIKAVINEDRPFLGICLGLQLLFEESEEFGPVKGLGILAGKVVKFNESLGLKIPHMGWNSIEKVGDCSMLQGILSGDFFYFVHSFYVVPASIGSIAAKATYGAEFAAAVQRGNLFACQFHPEKSGKVGLKILENFGRLCEGNL